MADAAVDFLLNKLTDLITNKKSHVVSLHDDLHMLKAFLRESVKKLGKEVETKELVRDIRNVVYEAEDIVDAFTTAQAVQRSSRFGGFWSSTRQLPDIQQFMQDVTVRVAGAITDIAFANRKVADERRPEKDVYQVRAPAEKNVVGFEDVTEELIARLTEETSYLDIVSLTGMFGLGKTTLAWKIYKDPRILYRFPYRKWITVSQQFSVRDIFISILKDFTREDLSSKPEQELAQMVAEYLEYESFLIVMDDVWSPSDWGRLAMALPRESMKGKVFITTRNVEVGKCASRTRPCTPLRLFEPEESWELLRLEALGKLDCPEELEDVGKRIANSCGGLPLALIVIGGVLGTKFSTDTRAMEEEWEKVRERVSSYLIDDMQNDTTSRMKSFISLSYDRLPYHLRSCFLYFGMFPEDYEIHASKLIQMWIAEGFIQQNNYWSLEETGERYLEDLINTNLVQIKKFKADGKVKTCAIYDALRDFCRAEAEQEHENFLREIKFNNGSFQPPADELQKYRRLSIHSKCSEFVSSKPFGPRVRTFVSFSKKEDEFTLEGQNISNILTAFKLLRVMDIKPMTFSKLASDMYQLVHLRYMVFSINSSVLPSKFSNLWNIQTLVVETTFSKLEIKADIWNMKNLRHFKTNASATLPKPNKPSSRHGAELQTLGTISVESCTASILKQACNLKKLGIRGRLALLLDEKNGFFDNMGKMYYLEKFKLINDLDGRPASEGKLRSLPQCYQFPSKLESLTLISTFLSWNAMPVLGLLENLEVLKLKDNAFAGAYWTATDYCFPHLRVLHISDTDLVTWQASTESFPSLKSLALRSCQSLIEIPEAIVGTLQTLDIMYVGETVVKSAWRIFKLKKEAEMHGKDESVVPFKLSVFPPSY